MLTIAWDVDDVLNDLMHSWLLQAWEPSHSNCTIPYSEINDNPPHRLLGISLSEYLKSLDAFRLSPAAMNMCPNPVVMDWLRAFGCEYRHLALTARPLSSAPSAAEWVFRHFGDYVRAFGVVPTRFEHQRLAYDRDKADFLRWFGNVDVLVDDSQTNIKAAEQLGLHGVLYPQPWNRSTQTVTETLDSIAHLAEAH